MPPCPRRCIGLQNLNMVLRAVAAQKELFNCQTTAESELAFLLEGYQLRDIHLSEKPSLRRLDHSSIAWQQGAVGALRKDVIEDIVQEAFSSSAFGKPRQSPFRSIAGYCPSIPAWPRIELRLSRRRSRTGCAGPGQISGKKSSVNLFPLEDFETQNISVGSLF